MTTAEKLFLQIFERKKRILDQVKDQILQFDHHLASKCIIEGFDPPDWLLSPAKSELSKEDLISGILLQQQQFVIPCPGTHSSLYQQAGFSAVNRHLPDRGVLSSKKCDTEAFTQRHSDKDVCVPNEGPELEPSVTSPKDCLGPTISGNDADPALSLPSFQRSKCRQKALALRNSAKAAESSSISKKNEDACGAQVTGSKVAGLQLDMDEVVLDKPHDRNLQNSAVNKENTDPCQSNGRSEDIYSGRTTRSRSSAKLLKSVNGSSGAGNPSFTAKEDGDTPTELNGKTKQQVDVDELLGGVKYSAISDESRQMVDAKTGDYSSSEKGNNADGGISMRPSSSQQHKRVQEDEMNNLNQQPDNVVEIMKIVESFDAGNDSCGINAVTGQYQMQDNIVDQSNGTVAMSGNTCTVEHCAEPPCISLPAVDHEVTGTTVDREVSESGLAAHSKSPLTKSSKKTKEVDLQVNSCHRVDPLPCTEPDRCDAIVADTDGESSEQVEVHSASSSSKFGSADKPSLVKSSSGLEGAGLVVSVSNLQSVSPIIVKPKQLDFDDMEECGLGGASIVPLEKEEDDKPSERKSSTPLRSSYGPAEVTPLDNLKSNSPLEVQLLDEGRSVRNEGKAEEACKPSWGSDSKAISSMKESDRVLEESNKNFKHSFCPIDHSANDEEEPKLSNMGADIEIDSSPLRFGGQLEVENSTKLVPTASNNSNTHDGHDLVGAECAQDSSPVLLKNADKAPCTISTYETKGDSELQKIKSGADHIHHEDSCSVDRHEGDENDIASVPTESNLITDQSPRKSMQLGRRSSSHMEGSSSHKRRKIESPLTCLLPASPNVKGQDGMRSNDKDKNVVCHIAGGSIPSSKLLADEGKLCLEEKETKEDSHFASILSSSNEAPAHSQFCLAEENMGADQSSITSDSRRQFAEESQLLSKTEEKLGQEDMEHLTCEEGSLLDGPSPPRENGVLSDCSLEFSCRQSMELLNAEQSNPVFERFIVHPDNEETLDSGERISIDKLELPKTSLERASLLEKLCRSACVQTPFSPFSTSYEMAYHSVPKGLLERMDMENFLSVDSDTIPKVGTSSFSEEINLAIHAKSFPFSYSHPTWDSKQPCRSPVGKLWDRMTSYSSSSEKRGSTIPELPCITEENENLDESADVLQDVNCSEDVICSIKRYPLTEIKEDSNVPPSISEAELCSFRNSLESVNTDYGATCSKNSVKRKASNRKASSRRDTDRLTGNQSMPRRANGTKRASESVSNRFSKPKLSGKQSLRKDGPSFSGKEAKVNNIVTHTSSFISLLPQKPALGIATGKRDVKVKALGAAEAAKRLEEKKENERKMKKEALKLERARLEQENQKQLELQKKRKEEERKKKEAEMAARKRQREEEDRLEKERKRKRMDDTRKQRQEAEEKLRVKKDEKEVKSLVPDLRANEIKSRNDQKARNKKMENEAREDKLSEKNSETEGRTTEVSTSDFGKKSADLEVHNAQVSETEKAARNDSLTTNTIQEESYDISPYKGSDDEDEEEEDDVPNKKFIPSWASKKSLASIVASQKELDPAVIFPLDSFCSIDTVLLPQKLQLR